MCTANVLYNFDENMPVLCNDRKFGVEFFSTTEVPEPTENCSSQPSSPKFPTTPKSAPRVLAPLKKCKNIRHHAGESPRTPSGVKSPVCKNLFQTSRTTESKQELKSFLTDSIKSLSNIQLRDAEQKYNFDFREFKPVQSDKLFHQSYTWSLVSQSDYIPEFYRTKENLEMPKFRDVKNLERAPENLKVLPHVSAISNVPSFSSSSLTSIQSKEDSKIGQKQSTFKRNDVIEQKNDVTKKRKRQARISRSLHLTVDSSRQPQITDYLPTVCKKPKMLSGKKL